MTPNELLDSVKARFKPLLVVEEDALKGMLVKALTEYQDRAGLVKRCHLGKEAGTSLPYPSDYLELVHITDKRGSLVFTEPYDDTLEIDLMGDERYPFALVYLANMRDCDLNKWEIPAAICGVIENYLECLIDIQNTERKRRVSVAGKLDVSHIPDEPTLYQRKIDLEDKMASNRAIITGASLMP
ncbi:hypothetical protein [Yersinia ruckeri]|uniref:hypothetical protein n=1 Tax=Yersinia ruckeri TaxID=29486 RepID=UPI0020BE6ADE|nr:hypothetical protein [Yersinia ruckeri]EKN4689567.1 hypothetical protein [Yersinia ruckeri]MCK8586410.1 hypothetical protein [Yersinia ruckeri]MCW6615652.1 hypothetical protein [Yersinia ruckeri]